MTDSIALQAGGAQLAEVFVEPAWLAEHLADPGIRVFEVDVSRAAYDQGHIPGAILWNAYADLRHADYSLLDHGEFEEILSRSGLVPSDTIVFYGYAPSLGFWLMNAYGHEHVLMLSGTRQGWREEGRPWTVDLPSPVRSTYARPKAEPRKIMALEALQEALPGVIGTGGPIILDVRSDAEFVGERFWPSGATEGAGRPGHIPGAVHVRSDLLRTAGGAFKSAAELHQLFQDHGVVPERTVITYCTIGNRASEVALVLHYLLGYPDVRVYYGSWAEWGTRTDTPIA